MTITDDFLNLVIRKINEENFKQEKSILNISRMFYDVTLNKGLVQLFGYGIGEEFVNELDYRAGGLITFHALRPRVAAMNKQLDFNEYISLNYLKNVENVDKVLNEYEISINDMYCLISIDGTESFINELAKRAKSNNQKVVALVNLKSYKKNNGTLLEYCDDYLDYGVEVNEYALDVNGIKCGQYSTTVLDVIAQEITAEVYKLFIDNEGYAPVLMSSNLHDSDKNNLGLIEKYGGGKRVHFNG